MNSVFTEKRLQKRRLWKKNNLELLKKQPSDFRWLFSKVYVCEEKMSIRTIKKNNDNIDKSMISEVLKDNEKRANRLSIYIFGSFLVILALDILLTVLGVFKLNFYRFYLGSLIVAIGCLVPIIAYKSKRVSPHILKWINLFCIIFVVAWCDLVSAYNSTLLMAVPIVFAVIYFSEKTTVITYIAAIITFAFTAYFGAAYYSIIDANHIKVADGTLLIINGTLKQTLIDYGYRNAQYITDMMSMSYFPRVLISIIYLVLAIAITKFGYYMLVKQAQTTADATRTGTELKFAGELQANALPLFSSINGKYNFEVAGSMKAAKEAGGDFYDFKMIDESHLALIIADVSGKGIPAAMFMMSSKEKLRSALSPQKSPGEIMFEVNNLIFENNKRLMFVTLWLGIIDINTGIMTSVNSGHLDPIIKKSSGSFEVMQEKRGPAVGIRKDKSYPEHEYKLEAGDILVLYTDGVTEARNEENKMYEIEGFVNGLNQSFANKSPSADEVNTSLSQQISSFVGKAEQADDITTLIFKYLN